MRKTVKGEIRKILQHSGWIHQSKIVQGVLDSISGATEARVISILRSTLRGSKEFRTRANTRGVPMWRYDY